MTYCKEFSALLDPYIDGELSPEETARVREHLHTCDGCRAYVQAALAYGTRFPRQRYPCAGWLRRRRDGCHPGRTPPPGSAGDPGGQRRCSPWPPAVPSWCWPSPACPAPAAPL